MTTRSRVVGPAARVADPPEKVPGTVWIGADNRGKRTAAAPMANTTQRVGMTLVATCLLIGLVGLPRALPQGTPAAPPQEAQFQEVPGILPGGGIWMETVTIFDSNEDGRLDLLFARCQGFQRPGDMGLESGDPVPPLLLTHEGLRGGLPVFADRTSELFPAGFAMHAKSAAAVDVDGDGRQDVVFAPAFRARPRLFVKDPATRRFVEESERLPPMELFSFDVAWGDLDDDGDLDLVFVDAGESPFRPPGAKPRLLINDGTGRFTERAEWIDAVPKIGAQNAKLVDLDGDLDLDLIVDGKSPETQVYRNDGTAHFTRLPDLLPLAATSRRGGANTYESEWTDLDGDDDVDGVILDLGSPRHHHAIVNEFSDTGRLAFAPAPSPFLGPYGDDDNEIAFVDADDDGFPDAVVASLGREGGPEKLFLNRSATLGVGAFVFVPGAFGSVRDASLDVDLADFVGDGRYDAVTAQGEGQPFEPRYYRNRGPADTHAPVIARVGAAPSTVPLAVLRDGLSRRARIQDSVWDDGTSWVGAELGVSVRARTGWTSWSRPMPHVGGQIHRSVLDLPPMLGGLVGADVEYWVEAWDPAGNRSKSPRVPFRVCGAETIDRGSRGSMLSLQAASAPAVGRMLHLSVAGELAGSTGFLVLGFAPASEEDSGDDDLLVSLADAIVLPLVTSGEGGASTCVPIPDHPALEGLRIWAQAGAVAFGTRSVLAFSNGLALCVCGQ